MVLQTKCIKAPILKEDGRRISIMSRHTLNDGITLDPEITRGMYYAHQVIFAPPDKLIGDYYKRGLPFEEFARRYLEYMRKNYMSPQVRELARMALRENITLLCIEETPERCHRKLLAEECKRLIPGLEVMIQ